MTIVLHRHCREIGYCNRGLREMAARIGVDWSEFLKHGIEADALRGNAMAERAIARAEEDSNGQQ